MPLIGDPELALLGYLEETGVVAMIKDVVR
jgi:hypothetical protein